MELQKDIWVKPDFATIMRHVFGWVLFILYEVSFVWLSTGKIYQIGGYVCYYTLNIGLFYFNAHVVLNCAFKKPRPYLLSILFLFIELACYLLIKYQLDRLLSATHTIVINQFLYFRKFVVIDLYRAIYFIGFSTLYWSILRIAEFRRKVALIENRRLLVKMENAELEKELAESRNAYLKHQINPHFLFNTLNYIYSTFYKFSEDASQCVLKLSEIMRYSLAEIDSDGKTMLKKEITQIRNLISINKLRFNHELYLRFRINGKIGESRIIPLILITLVENIFKHGNLKDKAHAAKLSITVDDDQKLTLSCWNLKRKKPTGRRLKTIGIENVIRRLDYSYRNHYKLTIREDDECYELELMMQL